MPTCLSLQFGGMQGDFDEMQGGGNQTPAKGPQISIICRGPPYSRSREALSPQQGADQKAAEFRLVDCMNLPQLYRSHVVMIRATLAFIIMPPGLQAMPVGGGASGDAGTRELPGLTGSEHMQIRDAICMNIRA